MNLAQTDPRGKAFRIHSLTRNLPPADAVEVLKVAAQHSGRDGHVMEFLAQALGRAGNWTEALAAAKAGRREYRDAVTLPDLAGQALAAGSFAEAEKIFGEIARPVFSVLLGIAIARKHQGLNFSAALSKARKDNEATLRKRVDWNNVSATYERVGAWVDAAMLTALEGDVAAARRQLASHVGELDAIRLKSVREECLSSLRSPSQALAGAENIASLCGL